MENLEKKRLERRKSETEVDPKAIPILDSEELLFDESALLKREDPSAIVFKESWAEKQNRIRKGSPFGSKKNWKLLSVIVKAGADLRQEQLALQLISEIQAIWQHANLPIWLYCYRVLVTSDNSGLIETVSNSISVHSIKKDAYLSKLNRPGFVYSLLDHFVRVCIKCFSHFVELWSN